MLSGFLEQGENPIHTNDIEFIDNQTGEIKEIFVPLLKEENIGFDMCIDEKQIGEDFFTVISNRKTGKLAFMANTTRSAELLEACSPILMKLKEVKTINRDLAGCYKRFSEIAMPEAKQVGDKFHVIKLLLDCQQAVRVEQKRQIETKKRESYKEFKESELKRKEALEKAGGKYKKLKFVYQEKVLGNSETPSEILRRSRYLLYKYPHQWTAKQRIRAAALFSEFPVLKKVYDLSLSFRNWYSKTNIGKHQIIIEKQLFQWYQDVEDSKITELMNFSSTVERNQDSIVNYFYCNGANNAMAENRNGKIKKFINMNQGTRDRDFFFFRLQKYFA